MKKFIISFFLSFFILFGIKLNLIFSQENSKKILILPFEIHAQQDLSYLKSAIPEMLTSRIFVPSKIEIIELEKVKPFLKEVKSLDKTKIQELGTYFKADYVIWGSLTVIGDMVSIDAQVLDLRQGKKPGQFYQEIKGLSEVIPQLSRFAKKAKNYIEGKEEDFYKEEVVTSYSPFALSRAHPERNFYSGNYLPYPGTMSYGSVSSQSQEKKPKVTRSKPRFSYDEDESLTKNLVIDLSKPQPVVGWAEEEKSSPDVSKSLATTVPSNPQPYPHYSQPYFYTFQEERGFLEKIWNSIWPFKKKEPQPSMIQIPAQVIPQSPPIYPSSKNLVSGGSEENPWKWD